MPADTMENGYACVFPNDGGTKFYETKDDAEKAAHDNKGKYFHIKYDPNSKSYGRVDDDLSSPVDVVDGPRSPVDGIGSQITDDSFLYSDLGDLGDHGQSSQVDDECCWMVGSLSRFRRHVSCSNY